MENIRTSDSPYRFARLTELINEDLPIDVSKAASILRDHKGLQNTDLGLANEMAINQFIAHHSVIFPTGETADVGIDLSLAMWEIRSL